MSLHEMAMFYAECMAGLKKQMRIPPKRHVRVLLIDDCEIAIAGVRTLLGHWNNLGLLTVIQTAGKMPYYDLDSDIALVDEDLDGTTGTVVAEDLRNKMLYGPIASIGQSEEKPQGFKYHFNRKIRVGLFLPDTKEFIEFMNLLIEEVLRNRME